MQMTRSLEDYRQEWMLEVAQFAQALGITEQTYRRLLREPTRVRMATRRLVFNRLKVTSPYLVAELAPRPSAILQAQARQAIEEANSAGWVAYDPVTLQPTGEIFDGQGGLI